MDIERELTNEEEGFLHGKCHYIAIALHNVTGLPLSATLDVDDWTEQTVLVHAYVMDGEEAIDIRGRFDPDNVGDDFPVSQPFETEISIEDLLMLATGKTTFDETDADYKLALAYAENIVSELSLNTIKP